MSFRQSTTAACLVLALAGTALAATNFVSIGTGAPPAVVGPISVTAFDLAPQSAMPSFVFGTTIPGCPLPTPPSDMTTSPAVEKRVIGAGWATWSHGYTGPVFFTGTGSNSVTLSLPAGANANAFYVYVEPNAFGLHEFTVTTDTGGTSGPTMVEGSAGAAGFGFFTDAGEIINTITVTNGTGTAMGFSVAEFGVGRQNGASCTITAPPDFSQAMGQIDIVFDLNHPMSLPVTATFEWSTDGGTTWSPATAAPGSPLPNPAPGLTTPSTGRIFVWDSAGDGVATTSLTLATFRITVNDGSSPPGMCTVNLFLDNTAPLPTCTVMGPGGTVGGNVTITVDPDSMSSMTVDILLLFSTDGVTYNPCTMAAGSPSMNPATGVSLAARNFLWDTIADGVGVGGVQTATLAAQIDDGVAPLDGECVTQQDIDNSALCNGICGDCNLNGAGPDIIDALVAAQIAAGLITPQPRQVGCCDVDASTLVTIIDALRIAQVAAGLPLTLTCL